MSAYRKIVIGFSILLITLLFTYDKIIRGASTNYYQLLLFSSWIGVIVELIAIYVSKALGYKSYLLKGFRYLVIAILSVTLVLSLVIFMRGSEMMLNVVVAGFNFLALSFISGNIILISDKNLIYWSYLIEMDSVDDYHLKNNVLFIQIGDRKIQVHSSNSNLRGVITQIGQR